MAVLASTLLIAGSVTSAMLLAIYECLGVPHAAIYHLQLYRYSLLALEVLRCYDDGSFLP